MPMNSGYVDFSVNDKVGEDYEKDLTEELIRNFERAANDRGTLDSHLEEIAARFYPMHKNLFTARGMSGQSKGEKKNQEVLDSTGILALQRFGAILDSLLTPRNSIWHSLTTNNDILKKDKNTMDWFEKATNILFHQRYAPTANFASQNQGTYKSLGGYGTGGLFIDNLHGARGIRYRGCHLSELYIQDNHQGVIDRVCRYFMLTARQALKMFGETACPKEIKDGAKMSPETPFYFLHWVVPRNDRDPQRKDFKGMEYASYYISMSGKKLLAEGGYETFPYALSRYEVCPGEVYGRSPAMDALPAIKTLNKQKELVLKQGQLAVDPVILLHDDGIMDGASIESGTHISGAVNADGRPLAQLLPFGRVDIGKDLMDDERLLINDTFLVRLFQILVESPEKTATQVIEETREKGILLNPTIGGIQSEYLGSMIPREMDVLSRLGMLPPMPRMLQEAEGEYEIQYDSPLSRTQKYEWVAGATRSINQALELAAQTSDPSYLDYFNWHKIMPQIAEIQGTPSSWMNSNEAVEKIRANRAEQAKQQQELDALPAVAGVMKAAK